MKLNQFIANLLDIVNKNPELAELEVISESHGTIFSKVQNTPYLVNITSEKGGFELSKDIISLPVNAILIN